MPSSVIEMDFITTEYYLFFLPVAFLLAMGISIGKHKSQIIILLGMSYIFFWLASGWHVLLLMLSTCVDWTAGSKIHSSNDTIVRKRWLKLSLIINLGLLAVFKYLDFIIESFNLVTLKFSNSYDIESFWTYVTSRHLILHLSNNVIHN